MPKPKAVVILGAGASVDFGVPPLKSLFKERYARGHLISDAFLRENLDRVFWGPRGHSLESSDESLTVEEMLTILRDWELEKATCGRAPDPALCARFRKSLYVLIKKAIYDSKNTRAAHLNPLLAFCRAHFESTTWASFNWDCVFESTFWYSQPYHGAGSRSNPTLVFPMAGWRNGFVSHTLLKLHGGINWWKIGGQLTYLSWGGDRQLNTKWNEYERGQTPGDEPVILEPSAYKYESPNYELLKKQWEVFFERLCEADCVIVIGYSLPENDSQARSRITIAGQVNQSCRWLVVDPSDVICQRYKRLLGHLRLTTEITSLAGFNNEIEDTLRRAFPMSNSSRRQSARNIRCSPEGTLGSRSCVNHYTIALNTTRNGLVGLTPELQRTRTRPYVKLLLIPPDASQQIWDSMIPDWLASDPMLDRYLEIKPPIASVMPEFQQIVDEIERTYVRGDLFSAISAACVSIERLLNLARMKLHKHHPVIKGLHNKGPSNDWDENIDALHQWGYLDDDFDRELKLIYKEIRCKYLHSAPLADLRADALRSINAAYALLTIFLGFPLDLFRFGSGVECLNTADPRYIEFYLPNLTLDDTVT